VKNLFLYICYKTLWPHCSVHMNLKYNQKHSTLSSAACNLVCKIMIPVVEILEQWTIYPVLFMKHLIWIVIYADSIVYMLQLHWSSVSLCVCCYVCLSEHVTAFPQTRHKLAVNEIYSITSWFWKLLCCLPLAVHHSIVLSWPSITL
jgi:hypothetical protein